MSFWSKARDITGGLYDSGAALVHGAGDIVGGGVKTLRDITGGAAGALENATGLNLKNPATLAALGLAAYGFYNPEAFTFGTAAGTGEGAAEAAAAGEGGSMLGTTGSTAAGAGSTAGNAAFTSELPAGYTPGSVDALTASAGPGTNIATAADTLPETIGAGSSGNGIQAAGFEGNSSGMGMTGTPSTYGTSSSAFGYGAGGETGIGAPSAGYFADQIPGVAAAGADWSLGDLGSAAWEGVKDNKLATAMVGSSLYDMYAKHKMAQKQDELYHQNRADILGMYAPGSPEAKAMEQQMARQDAAAGRNSQYGIRATDYAANVAKFKANALAQAANAQSGLAAAQMGNQYGGLNSMFNNLAMYSLLNKSTR